MNYIELKCQIKPYSEDFIEILIAHLSEIGYESFNETENGVNAYIQEFFFDIEKIKNLLANQLKELLFCVKYSHKKIGDKDWNAIWESNFKPIVIADKVIVRASFHTNTPNLLYDIIIDPKMSFGTGHHATTSLMIQSILDENVRGKEVLDMGCGTSILAILAAKKGAAKVTAVDINEWAYNNSIENIKANGIDNVNVLQGDSTLLKGRCFDIILANINRNILLNDMKHYTACMKKESILIMSGFYLGDLKIICEEAIKNNLVFKDYKVKDNWVTAKFFVKNYDV